MEDDEIRALVTRLSRPHPSGGEVIERAAILAEGGAGLSDVLKWIEAHGGKPEAIASAAAASHGLHGPRPSTGRADPTPLRFVLPAGVLA